MNLVNLLMVFRELLYDAQCRPSDVRQLSLTVGFGYHHRCSTLLVEVILASASYMVLRDSICCLLLQYDYLGLLK